MSNERDKENRDRDYRYYCEFPFHNLFKRIGNLDLYNSKRKRFPLMIHSWGVDDECPMVYQEDTEHGFTLFIEIPGISKEEIELEVTSEELWLQAKNEKLNKSYRYHKIFRESINPEEVEAHLKAGILSVDLTTKNKNNKTRVKIN